MPYETIARETEGRKPAPPLSQGPFMGLPAERIHGIAVRVFILLAIVYALFAGLRTVSDPDLGWQLATGRYIIQHHQIPSYDVFSYTAAGKEWIYPPFSGVVFYWLFLAAGYAGLSWFCALACAATIALMTRKSGAIPAALAILAVPFIAIRTAPRADLFTTLLFAAFLAELWRFHRGARAHLWLLPILMLLWVNLHPGFMSGIGLMAAYLLIEAFELPFSSRRTAALERLQKGWPWLALTAVATLINPWGPKIYAVLPRLNRGMEVYSVFIGEWSRVPLSLRSMAQAFALREPESSYWCLVLVALAAIGLSLWRRQAGVALLLASALYFSLRYIRFQSLFAIVAVIVGGAILTEAVTYYRQKNNGFFSLDALRTLPVLPAAMALMTVAFLVLACVRISDLTSNRYYVLSSSTSVFGPGESWWFPERAAAFIERENLPGNIFEDYQTGGFLSWRLGPKYRDYIDGRAVPFGTALFIHHQELLAASPDSPAWQSEADSRDINVLFFSLARFGGLGAINLQSYCQSTAWRPIYLDEVSVVLLRNRPENRPWLDRLQINCHKQQFMLKPPFSRTDFFNFCANTGAVLYVMGQDQEALAALDSAESIYPFDPGVHLTRAQLFQQEHHLDQAEREYRAALSRKPTDAAWYGLGRLYASEHRYDEAAQAIEISAKLSFHPYNNYKSLGMVDLALKQPRHALEAFSLAEKQSPFHGDAAVLGNEFLAQLEDGRAEAWRNLGESQKAIAAEQRAVEQTPESPARWNKLADLRQSAGEDQLAQQARQRARELTSQAALPK